MEKDLKVIKQVFEAFDASLKKNVTDSTEFKKHTKLVEATLELLRKEINTNIRFITAQSFKNSFDILDIQAFEHIIDCINFEDTTDTENFNAVKDIAIYAIYTLINIAAKKVKKEKSNE